MNRPYPQDASQPSEQRVFTVSEITRIIKGVLEDNFAQVVIEGEISNYKLYGPSGHRYFSLKDDGATLSAVMWKSSASALKFNLENGMKVRAFGSLALYEPRGQYQLNVRRIEPLGVGELEIAFRQLYERLNAEGVFAADRKRALPSYPFNIGIVTSPSGAAIRDMINVFTRRNPLQKLVIYPAAVQGKGAEFEIEKGIDYFNTRSDIDLIITGRGGGSLEDLWRFNTETVVRAIERSTKPVVTGVGHEIDWTLADFVADYRAPTPSAAAEVVAWELDRIRGGLTDVISEMADSLEGLVAAGQEELFSLLKRGVFADPYQIVHRREQELDHQTRRFSLASVNNLRSKQSQLTLAAQRLDSLSPLKTLSRGYAVARAHEVGDLNRGDVIRDAAQLHKNDAIEVIFNKGAALAKVLSTSKNYLTETK